MELTSTIQSMIAEIGELDHPEKIGLDQHLIEDLGLDSMLLLELLSSLEQTYSISIPETEYPNMTTVNACAEVVRRYQAAA
ncbi:MAG: acyl carrier protein [Proteobacteria bacterium]|jgi:acyl carrier protein|nr:acyl carrier protein [Pseudomonadota bacterium]MBK8481458.1 acyl carrier protein [Pseudomonadota bacterium]